jgi:peptide chain release factor 2
VANRRLAELNAKAEDPKLWDDPSAAQALLRERTRLERAIDSYRRIEREVEDAVELIGLGDAEGDAGIVAEAEAGLDKLRAEAQRREVESLLSGEADANDCYLEVHAGAGGTEAQDWAEMLLRMYLRWAEQHDYKAEWLEESGGEVAGIKSATVKISGPDAYGWLKTESGVHRLVRISPYDANARRHTSFSSVSVLPMIDNTIKVEIAPGDLRIDTMRAGGAGGQHVNKTESAVRITHLPTGLVVQSQAERSQHRNKDAAMKILMSRIFVLREAEERAKTAVLAGEKKDIDFGSQIRSYVLQPYTMANDHRTETKLPDVHRVLDGDLDPFIDAWLKSQQPRKEPA